jgi:hypothetical protein
MTRLKVRNSGGGDVIKEEAWGEGTLAQTNMLNTYRPCMGFMVFTAVSFILCSSG